MSDTKKILHFLYGTAWKEGRTADLVFQALQAGFTGIDTANQRKHYNEEGVGVGIKRFLDLGQKKRESLFLQTKFTFARGQDHRKPYNESDTYTKQVSDSFASSLTHLHTSYLDSYVLHGPYSGRGITAEDEETWSAMEKLVDSGKVKSLGISNVNPEQLVLLCRGARIKPKFVQNRCYAQLGWDLQVREICASEGILYQGFSLLTANYNELSSPEVAAVAKKYGKTIPQITFRFCRQIGMICLTGTTDTSHMRADLEIDDFELTPSEVALLQNIAS